MKEDKFIEIKKSEIEGSGVFVLKDFKKGEKVYSFSKGRVITSKEIKNLSEMEKAHLDKIGEDRYEIIELPACYVNHSCDPNVVEKEGVAYALKDIKKREEITIDYDRIAHLGHPFQCDCGSKNCIKTVQGKQ